MEVWEEEGFASEEAYKKHQQTIKELEESKKKLSTQVEEKQKIIDENRTKISDLSQAEKELKELKEKEAEAEKKRKEAEEAEAKRKLEAQNTPEAVAAQNKKRIDSLNPSQREALEKEFNEATPEQHAMLSTAEGLQAFLDLKVGPVQGTILNPFAVTKSSELTVKEQVARAFKIANPKATPAVNQEGSGFTPSEKVIAKVEKTEADLEEARAKLLW